MTGEIGDAVRALLTQYRRTLYDGRGPGIDERAWLENTSLRARVGGVPAAVSRMRLHLRTLRMRGEIAQADLQERWAAEQFHEPR